MAAELSATCEPPLDVAGLCREFGLGLRVAPADGARRGALMRAGAGWEVVLMRHETRPAPISPQERFTVAHELGHYVLMRETPFRIERDADYWLGEELCNRFASRLLIPDVLLDQLDEPGSPVDLAAAVCALANGAGVTFEPAARALVRRLTTPVALGTFRLDPYPPTGRLGFRGWWVESRSWWGVRGGRRLAVYADHALAPVLRGMRAMAPGQTAAPALAGARATRLRRSGGVIASFSALLA